jgi:hypothetical protein
MVFALVGCDMSDFGDTNVDPRTLPVSQIPTRTLLTYSLQQLPFTVFNTPVRQDAGYATQTLTHYAQYLSEGPYPTTAAAP